MTGLVTTNINLDDQGKCHDKIVNIIFGDLVSFEIKLSFISPPPPR